MTEGYFYIMSSYRNGTLYCGVTNNLLKRVYEHKNNIFKGFTYKYEVKNLVYYEKYNDIYNAIEREKQVKGWNRIKKINLIEDLNKEWIDLSKEWFLDSSLRSE
jgi:putative endonuclease